MKNVHYRFLLIILAISTGLMGVSILLMGHHQHITLTTNFFHITSLLSGAVFNSIAGISFVLTAVISVISIVKAELRKPLGVLIILMSITALLPLMANSMWIESLGGFPAIGAGQGIIKYFALLALGLVLAMPTLKRNQLIWINLMPVVLVLLWIGGMKFTLLEAKGIEDLVRTSPLMSWMYQLWDIQTTSNLIGIYDIIALSLLLMTVYFRALLLPAVLMSGAVFIVTQTFFISWPAASSTETLLTTGGHFLIKDLWFIANLVIFTLMINKKS